MLRFILCNLLNYSYSFKATFALGRCKVDFNVNVNVSVYCLKSPLSSADFTIYAPGIGTLSYTVSSPLGRIQHLRTLLQLQPIITIQRSRSTRYPSLQGGQRQHDMRGLPNTPTHDWSCATTVWELQSGHIAMSAVPDIKCSLCHVHQGGTTLDVTFTAVWKRTPGSCVAAKQSDHWTTHICIWIDEMMKTNRPSIYCLSHLLPQHGYIYELRKWSSVCLKKPNSVKLFMQVSENEGKLESESQGHAYGDKLTNFWWS